VVQILEARSPLFRRRSHPMVQRAGADLVLTPGRASEIVLADHTGMEVLCQFNRLFTGLPTTNQRPDAVITIRGGNRLLLIDAKYRLGRDPNYIRRYGLEGPLADDINVIHRYRDAIVAPLPPHRRLSNAGLIAFPGRESSRYLNHQFYRSWLSVRVGGMPMLPSGSDLMEQTINDYLDEMALEGTA
jgi:PD-(D/E)XK nuclease superfamily